MSFVVRPFQSAVDAFAATQPGKQLRDGKCDHYDNRRACSFADLSKWARRPPLSSIYLQRSPFEQAAVEVLRDARSLVEYCNFGAAVGTWNAKGAGRWAREPGAWAIVDVQLTQEQADDCEAPGDFVPVIFALWHVEEGLAAAVWRSGEQATLAQVMGLPAWPSGGWEPCQVWYGE